MEKENVTVTCRECGDEFVITTSEQKFYEERELSLPKRCSECRAARKAAANADYAKKEKPKQSLEDMMKDAFGTN